MGLYKVVFLGLAVVGPAEELRLIEGLKKKFNLPTERAERLLQRVPIVVKKGVSKEEMEKYVKAFEEIGARVRVEMMEGETIKREPEIPKNPEPERKPYRVRMISCPQCGFEQPEAEECLKCGVIISKHLKYEEMARVFEGQVKEVSSEEKFVPWESGEGLGKGFFKTVKGSLFSPAQFYKGVANGEGYWLPLIYGIICYIIGWGVNVIWAWYFWYNISQYFLLHRIPSIFGSFAFSDLVLKMVSLPFIAAFVIFFYSVLVHLCLFIVGGNKKGFQASFRAVSYAFSGDLFRIIPIIGFLIGWIYCLALAIIGSRETHGISTGKAVIAVLLPLIVVAGLVIIAVILIPLFFGSARIFGGEGV